MSLIDYYVHCKYCKSIFIGVLQKKNHPQNTRITTPFRSQKCAVAYYRKSTKIIGSHFAILIFTVLSRIYIVDLFCSFYRMPHYTCPIVNASILCAHSILWKKNQRYPRTNKNDFCDDSI